MLFFCYPGTAASPLVSSAQPSGGQRSRQEARPPLCRCRWLSAASRCFAASQRGRPPPAHSDVLQVSALSQPQLCLRYRSTAVPGLCRSESADSGGTAAPGPQTPSAPPPPSPAKDTNTVRKTRTETNVFNVTAALLFSFLLINVMLPFFNMTKSTWLLKVQCVEFRRVRVCTFLRSFSAASICALIVLSNLFSNFGFFFFAAGERTRESERKTSGTSVCLRGYYLSLQVSL